MSENNFRDSVKVPETVTSNHLSQMEKSSIEALYLYTDNSLYSIYAFLRDYYFENPSIECTVPPIGRNYYYSLYFELSHAHDDFLAGNLSIQDLNKQFNKLCSHYKTDPLTIFETYSLVENAKKDPSKDLDSLVESIQDQVSACWEQMKADRENQNEIE